MLTISPPGETVGLVKHRPLAAIALAVLALAAGLACRSQGGPGGGPAAELKGKTIGVVSLSDVPALETRYVLHNAYGLDTTQKASAVTFVEVPPDALAAQLQSGQIDAAVLSQAGAYRLLNDGGVRVISNVSKEARRLAGGPFAGSVLLSYTDVVQQKSDALRELDRVLALSVAYYKANESTVLRAVAAQQAADPAFLRWQAGRQELPLGDLSQRTQEALVRVWRVAADLGDIERVPDLKSLLFQPPKQQDAAGAASGRVTVSLAVLDDPSRRAALYAIEQAIATSAEIDIAITYVAPSALAEAATTKQYDIIEAQPLVVPASAAKDVSFVVVSAGLLDLDSTLLFARSDATPD